MNNPNHAQPTAQEGTAERGNIPPQENASAAMGGEADRQPNPRATQRERNANYAVKVICREARFTERTLSILSGLLVFFVVLGVVEILAVLWLFTDDQARIILVSMFVVTVTICAIIWIPQLVVHPAANRIAIITCRGQPRLVHKDEVFWRIPLLESLYDMIPLTPVRYDCRVEFREDESAASPDIYQDIYVQYQVGDVNPNDQDTPLLQGVRNQLALSERKRSQHPMLDFWNKQISDGLQRYFEDLDPEVIPLKIKNPRTNLLEGDILNTLRALANRQGWGINITDVHLRHYHFK